MYNLALRHGFPHRHHHSDHDDFAEVSADADKVRWPVEGTTVAE